MGGQNISVLITKTNHFLGVNHNDEDKTERGACGEGERQGCDQRHKSREGLVPTAQSKEEMQCSGFMALRERNHIGG